jgi:hypothetical protein
VTSGDADRAVIQAAADRLLAGTPLRSTGELTVVQLAAEAGVKRWLLTHTHRDLAEQFQARVRATAAKGIGFHDSNQSTHVTGSPASE